MAYSSLGLLSYTARTSMAVPKPTGAAMGDRLLIVAMVEDLAVAVSGPGKQIAAVDLDPFRWVIFAVEQSGKATYSVTWGGASRSCEAASFSFTGRSEGAVVGEADEGLGESGGAPAISTPAAGYDLIALGFETAGIEASPPSGMTERLEGDGSQGSVYGLHVATQDAIASGSTGAKTWTWDEERDWATLLVALAPAEEPPAPIGPRPGSLSLLGVGR